MWHPRLSSLQRPVGWTGTIPKGQYSSNHYHFSGATLISGGAFCSSTLKPVFFSYLGRLLFFNSKKSPSKKHHLGSMTTHFNDGKKNSNKNTSQPPKRLKLKTSEVPMFKNFKWIVGMEPTCDLIICQKWRETKLQKPKTLAARTNTSD